MEQEALGVELGDQLARTAHAGEHGLGGEDPAQRFGIGRVDVLSFKLGKQMSEARRRAPIDVYHGDAVGGEVAGETGESDVDDPQRPREQRLH